MKIIRDMLNCHFKLNITQNNKLKCSKIKKLKLIILYNGVLNENMVWPNDHQNYKL